MPDLRQLTGFTLCTRHISVTAKISVGFQRTGVETSCFGANDHADLKYQVRSVVIITVREWSPSVVIITIGG
jgi:hypothetical protein